MTQLHRSPDASPTPRRVLTRSRWVGAGLVGLLLAPACVDGGVLTLLETLDEILLEVATVEIDVGESLDLVLKAQTNIADSLTIEEIADRGFEITFMSSDTTIVTVTPDGVITGIAPGTATITAMHGSIEAQSVVTVMGDDPLAEVRIVTTTLPGGEVGEAYSTTLQASDGDGSYVWELLSGDLPAGLMLSAAGVISGVPTTAGAETFTVRVSSAGMTDGRQFSLTVSPSMPDGVRIVTSSLPNAEVTDPYSFTLQAEDGDGSYDWDLSVGTLPAGLTLSASGVISGVPSVIGSRTFTVQVESAGTFDTRQLTLNVTEPPPDVAFISDFSTAQGNSNAALLDTSQDVPWERIVGSGELSQVIPSGALDFPTANVLRVEAGYRPGDGGRAETWLLDDVLPIPGVGESLYYRWYFRMEEPDAFTADRTTHPMQDGLSNQNWAMQVINRSDGRWEVEWSAFGSSWPNNRWGRGTLLDKGVTYRFELQILRTGTSTYNMNIRIYNAAGVMILDNSDMANINGSTTLADSPTLNLVDPNSLGDFTAGFNGKSGGTVGEYPFITSYQGGFCVRTVDWCGAY